MKNLLGYALSTWILSTAVATASFAGLPDGAPAPAIEAKDQDGKTFRLSDQKGKWVLLYFYPKDDTPGCTKQACDLRDDYSKYKKAGIEIFGVSTQGAKSHQEFKAKHKLPFDLLVDEDGKIGEAFGVSKIPIMGIYKRQSVLIAPEGKVARFFENVDAAKHSKVVFDLVSDLRTNPSP
jgi:peroxiredoxin Q/BCP